MSERERFFVGTYTNSPSQSRGIMTLDFDLQTGQFGAPMDHYSLPNPSFLTLSEHGLYSFSELAHEDGARVHFKPNQGDPVALKVEGDYPCHVDEHNGYLALANYGSGNVLVYRLDEAGIPQPAIADLFVEGHGPNLDRQTSPHAHQVTFLKQTKQLAVVDLGADRVHIYDYDTKQHQLYLAQSIVMPAGSGPRHLVFSRAETRAYVVCELSETLVMITKTDEQWSIESQSHLLPSEPNGEAASAVRLSTDERHLYVSCRAQNQIALFDVSGEQPHWVSKFYCGGAFPRDFVLSRDNQWLIVANQHSSNLVSYRRDPESGELSATGFECQIDQPVCVVQKRDALR